MCGINGAVASTDSFDKNEFHLIITQMNQEITHRGPDDDGLFISQYNDVNIGMGMRRLAIIDISTGKQPIYNDDASIVIVFNGEIYNFRSLRLDLEKEGVLFKTTSDTEVILRLYERDGVSCFGKLDGMFAFSIFDKRIGKIFIVRDFFGEKPLYYTTSGKLFYWASELKSILKVLRNKPIISKQGLNLYFQLTYIPAPFTIYEDIHKLEANHYIVLDCNTISYSKHEITHDLKEYAFESKKEAIQLTHDLVQQSVVSRSVSDVPLGTFLSGGVDSSIVSLSLAQANSVPIDTFSIGFEKKSFDETEKSRTVAKLINSNHHEFVIGEKDLTTRLSDIILNFDEPFADSSALASYVVANKTKQFVKVALTGDGGDELFGGYNKYLMGMLNQRYTSIVPENVHSNLKNSIIKLLNVKDDNRGIKFKLTRLLKAINYDGDFYYNIISLGFTPEELRDLLISKLYISEPLSYYKINGVARTLTDFRNIDLRLSLEGDLNVKVDRTSMLTSLECRAPFLNKDLWNFSKQLPEQYLIKGFDKKQILKEAFKQYFPDKFLDKSKKGFAVPVGDWLRSELRNELESYIERSFLEKQNIFYPEEIIKLVNNHIDRKVDNTFRVWTFFCFQKWYTSHLNE